jgi:hypothetical protein
MWTRNKQKRGGEVGKKGARGGNAEKEKGRLLLGPTN